MNRSKSFVLMVFFSLAAVMLPSAKAAPEKVACIGDSITFGATIKDRATNSFPMRLGQLLGKDYAVKNFGVNGATMLKNGNKPYWRLKQFKMAQDFNPDIVIIMLGTNDSKPPNWKHKDEFEANYREMVNIFKTLDSKPVIYICDPIPVFADKWGINNKTVKDEIIPIVNKIAKEMNVNRIDLYSVFDGKSNLVSDKIHPNKAGAKLIAETLYNVLTGKAGSKQ